jgi:hypothetical protein
MLGSGIRRFDGEDSAQARDALAGGFDNRTTGSSKRSRALFSRG